MTAQPDVRQSSLLPPLSLYVHWPWCVQKCPYCDFNSHTAQTELVTKYAQALLADWQQQYALLGAGRKISSIFFGGGTPSLAPPSIIAQLIDLVAKEAGMADTIEITLEANPGTLDYGNFSGYRQAGVNRLSLGIQSFDDQLLHRIGRIHTAQQAIKAIELAHHLNFDRINLDLMTGLPSQTEQQVITDIQTAIHHSPDHLSLYQLTVEPNTPFFSRPPPLLPDEDQADMLQHTAHLLAQEAGYQRYEVSAFAKAPPKQCQHNLNYWQFGDYLGIGAGAHGKLTLHSGQMIRTTQVTTPHSYIQSLQKGEQPTQIPILTNDLPFEFLLNALRLTEGVDCALFMERTGLPLTALEPRWTQLAADGLLLPMTHARLSTTEMGYRHLNGVLLAWLSTSH